MRSTSALLFAALALTAATATTAWAGTGTHGPSQQQQKASYGFCYGGDYHVVYFSRVFAITGSNGWSSEFGHYLDGMGYHSRGLAECRGTPTMANATAFKQETESRFRDRKVVETDWAGH